MEKILKDICMYEVLKVLRYLNLAIRHCEGKMWYLLGHEECHGKSMVSYLKMTEIPFKSSQNPRFCNGPQHYCRSKKS